MYRINEGEWKNYQDKAVRIEIDDVIETKGIDKDGKETEVSSYQAVLPDDALKPSAYDNKTDAGISYVTTVNASTTLTQYVLIDESMLNDSIDFIYSSTKGYGAAYSGKLYVTVLGKNDEVLSTYDYGFVATPTVYKIIIDLKILSV